MNKTVFISSTYGDLKKYRRAIWELLEGFDVNVRGMERFGAQKETPLATCLTQVEQSDIYLGVIAYRLGSVEPTSGKSYTQVEYERAYERQKDIRIYLADDENSLFLAKNINKDEKAVKLEAFKQLLRERHTIETFLSDEDLQEKLDRDLTHILTQKEAAAATPGNEYEISEQVIDRFLLTPNDYSGREIRLRLKFKGEPYAASKALCSEFNLDFGSTIGRRIQIIKPGGYQKTGIDELYAGSKRGDVILATGSDLEIDLYAKLQFAGTPIGRVEATYKSFTYYPEEYSDPNEYYERADAKVILLFSKLPEG